MACSMRVSHLAVAAAPGPQRHCMNFYVLFQYLVTSSRRVRACRFGGAVFQMRWSGACSIFRRCASWGAQGVDGVQFGARFGGPAVSRGGAQLTAFETLQIP